jgi:hypothetical protein
MNTDLEQATGAAASAKSDATVGAIFGATPGTPGMFKSNFDCQLVRGNPATLGDNLTSKKLK